MDRLEWIRLYVDKQIDSIQDVTNKKLAFIHTYGVSQNCALLALKRNVNVELACIAGMLHDLSLYMENCPHKIHAKRSSEIAKHILEESDLFSEDEIHILVNVIAKHSDKLNRNDGKLSEVLKDADVLQHYLYNVNIEMSEKDKYRLFYLLEDLKQMQNKTGNHE